MYVLCLTNGLVYILKATDLKGVEAEAVAMCSRMNRGATVHLDHTKNPQIAGIGWNGDRYQMQAVDLHND